MKTAAPGVSEKADFPPSVSSLYLFKLGLAPQIQDLYGKVDFTGKGSHKRQEKYLIVVGIAWRISCAHLGA